MAGDGEADITAPSDAAAREQSSHGLSVRTHPRSVHARLVLDSELDQLIGSAPSPQWTFFGISVGAAVTLVATAFAAPTGKDLSLLVFASAVLTALSAYFLINALVSGSRSRQVLEQIKSRQTYDL